ncbi:hypothetical protein FB446DRAFT_845093 [Lentinula raphanica]|nr:hypothetical protein FB446DRAFT_845093 [Lentinula raphanica]
MSHSIFTNSFKASHRYIIDNINLAWIIFIAGMIGIMCQDFLGGGDRPLRARGHTALQKLGALLLLPFGLKVASVYYLVYLLCAVCLADDASRTSDRPSVVDPKAVQHTQQPVVRNRFSRSLHTRIVQLPSPGWSIDLKYSLNIHPNLKFVNWHFDFAEGLDRDLAMVHRSTELLIEYFVERTKFARDEAIDTVLKDHEARFKLIHRQHRAVTTYEFALKCELISIPLDDIPPQFREGKCWSIEVPDFGNFCEFMGTALVPNQQVVKVDSPKSLPYRQEYRSAVDLAQAKIPILIPILESVSFESNLESNGVIHDPFFRKTIVWDKLTYISLKKVKIFARDYRYILSACPKLRKMDIERPGEGYGAYELPDPGTGLVRADRLATLHLTDCKMDIRDFLSASAVDLSAVTELVLTTYVPQSIGPADFNVNWAGIRVLKVSDTFGAHFINGCIARLPPAVIHEGLEVIDM